MVRVRRVGENVDVVYLQVVFVVVHTVSMQKIVVVVVVRISVFVMWK